MKRRTLLGTTLSALALSLMALSATAYSADTATTAVAASSALFNYTEEGHEALPLATMDAATAQQLAASFKYSQEPKVVAQDVAYALMQQKGAVVVDVREPHEYAAGHIPGAYNIPKDTVLSNADLTALKDQQIPIMVYCRSGGRAGDVLDALAEDGFSYVMNIGGVLTWPYGLTTEPIAKPFAEAAAEVKAQK